MSRNLSESPMRPTGEEPHLTPRGGTEGHPSTVQTIFNRARQIFADTANSTHKSSADRLLLTRRELLTIAGVALTAAVLPRADGTVSAAPITTGNVDTVNTTEAAYINALQTTAEAQFGRLEHPTAFSDLSYRQLIDLWNGNKPQGIETSRLAEAATAPEDAGGVEAYTIRVSEMPKNARQLIPGVWTASVPQKLMDAYNSERANETANGISTDLTAGLPKGDRSAAQGILVQADGNDTVIPLIIDERGVWNGLTTPSGFNVARVLTYRDLALQQITVSADGSLTKSIKANLDTTKNVPIIGDNDPTSQAPNISVLRNDITAQGDENFEIGNGKPDKAGTVANLFVDKNGNTTTINQADLSPAQQNQKLAQVLRGHYMPESLVNWLDQELSGGKALFQFGYPISSFKWVKIKAAGVEATYGFQLLERGVATLNPDGKWQIGLSGNTYLAAINNGKDQLDPITGTDPEPNPPSNEKHLTEPRTKYRKTAGSIESGKEYPGFGDTDALLGKSGNNFPLDPEFPGMVFMETRIQSIDKTTKTAVVYIDGGNNTVTIHIPDSVSDTNNRFARAQRTIYNQPIKWEDKYIYNQANAYIDIEGENPSSQIKGDATLLFFTQDEYKNLKNNTAKIAGFDLFV